MRKRRILSVLFIFSFLALSSAAFLVQSTLVWAEETKLMPMELDGTEWEITTTYVTTKGKKNTGEDILLFKDKKFVSKSFDKKGYDPTNYSLTLQDDGATRFGTMQIKGKDTSFWKGTLKDDTINGSVHTQFSGGESTRTTYFKGKLVTGELKRKAERKPTPPPAPPVPEPVAKDVTPKGESKSVIEKVKEAAQGTIEKVQNFVGSGSDDAAEKVVDQSEETGEAQ